MCNIMHNTFGTIIRNRRKLLGLSQQDLAEMAGIGLRTLINIERDQGNPSLNILNNIASILGLELSLQIRTMES